MPTISYFYGIIIMMRLKAKEHDPPHIHVIYGERSGIYAISNSKRIKGNLPKRAEKWWKSLLKRIKPNH